VEVGVSSRGWTRVGAVFSSLVVEETRMVATDMVQNNKVDGILESIVQIEKKYGQLNALPHVHFRPINVVVWPRALPD
jgi:hypothetical protein